MLPPLMKNSKGSTHMGRIVITEYMSVDGVVEAPSGTENFKRVGWVDAFSRGPEGDKFKLDETMNSDALLLGRVTYDGFAAVWPHYGASSRASSTPCLSTSSC
jgi:dihydrofolate reductase